MEAIQYSKYGGPDVLEVKEIERPVLKDGQVLVRVKAAAINPFDFKLRRGDNKDSVPLDLPVVIGADYSGVVSEVPEDVTDFKAGDEVYGSAIVLNGGSGAFAEFAASNTNSMALKPASLSFTEAAAFVLVGVSAIQTLDQLDLSKGKKLLIHGGGGGVGSSAIQYAKHLGAYVATTARESDKDFVDGLGADEVINYEAQDFSEILSDYYAVLDTVGGETYTKSFKILKPGGRIISMNMSPDEELARRHGVTALLQSSKVNTYNLNRVRELVDHGVFRPQVDKVFPLEQAAEAFDYQESGKAKGKVVVKI